MEQIEIHNDWSREIQEGRRCGECHACCIYLGINALKKWPGQACKHLTGANGPNHRCSIYPTRPNACQIYKCLWLEGIGPDSLKPSKSGMFITIYPPEDDIPGAIEDYFSGTMPVNMPVKASATIQVFDTEKASVESVLEVAAQLMILGIDDVRMVFFKQKLVLHMKDGQILKCKLRKPDKYEALVFEREGEPLASFILKDPTLPNPEEQS